MIGKILVASYLYYHKDFSLMDDTEFDMLCKNAYDNWDTINHPHKHLLDQESLKAGTLYHLDETDYPLIVRTIGDTIVNWVNLGKDYIEYLKEVR